METTTLSSSSLRSSFMVETTVMMEQTQARMLRCVGTQLTQKKLATGGVGRLPGREPAGKNGLCMKLHSCKSIDHLGTVSARAWVSPRLQLAPTPFPLPLHFPFVLTHTLSL